MCCGCNVAVAVIPFGVLFCLSNESSSWSPLKMGSSTGLGGGVIFFNFVNDLTKSANCVDKMAKSVGETESCGVNQDVDWGVDWEVDGIVLLVNA